jgi:FkbM family methyltransferase
MYSFGQNGEDVILDRVFSGVPRGRYIDAGAGHPVIRSISYHFYRRGWRGILVEPHPELFRLICDLRPDDQVFAVALGAETGSVNLHCTEPWGYSSTDEHLVQGRTISRTVAVPQLSIMSLLASVGWVLSQDIHFLILDVEGSEMLALRGIDLQQVRPWVIVIESIHAVTRTEHRPWRHLLEEQNYTWVLFDGVSDYYLAHERRDLSSKIHPPCSTDSYEPYVPRIDLQSHVSDSEESFDLRIFADALPTTTTELRDFCRSLMASGILPSWLMELDPSQSEALRAVGLVLQLTAVRLEQRSGSSFDFHL